MIRAVITDIEGTTTSVTFVYNVLFPYFRERVEILTSMLDDKTVRKCFDGVISLVKKEEERLIPDAEIPSILKQWSEQDRKITELKVLQGVIWEAGYKNGEIKGHLYPEVNEALKNWSDKGVQLGVYSSGSVAAQKLLFGFSDHGDLTGLFSYYFDTTVGQKREPNSYYQIQNQIEVEPAEILFLSDVVEELDAAIAAGWHGIQLVREGTVKGNIHQTVQNFNQIDLNNVR